MNLKKCLLIILLSIFLVSLVSGLEIKRIEDETTGWVLYLLSDETGGGSLFGTGEGMLFAFPRATFEAVGARVTEAEILEEENEALRSYAAATLLQYAEERGKAVTEIAEVRSTVFKWKLMSGLLAIATVVGFSAGAFK